MDLDKKIFKGKTLSNLFEEIYSNSVNTKSQVKALIADLKPLIENIGDATLVVPLIKEYMEIGVKNDEHLIKLATVIQRLESASMKSTTEADVFGDIESILADIQDEESTFHKTPELPPAEDDEDKE